MLNKVEGYDIVDKYVTKVKKEKKEPEHVGGPIATDADPIEDETKLNKHGISGRDY